MTGVNFRSSLSKRTFKGKAFVAVKEHTTFGGSDHHEVSFEILEVFGPTEYQRDYAGSLMYNEGEEEPGFDHLKFASGFYGIPAITRQEMKQRVEALEAAASKAKAEALGQMYLEKYIGVQSVALPSDLSLVEKRKFLAAFSRVRGARQNLADLFAVGSMVCVGPGSDRNIHFEHAADGLRCSTLGCAVLGITAGVVPENQDPEVMFWAVHAAARLISGSLQPVALIHTTAHSMQRGFGPGSKLQYHHEGYWGPREIFEVLLKSRSFEELADYLCAASYDKDLGPGVFEKSSIHYGSYEDYIRGRTSFGKY